MYTGENFQFRSQISFQRIIEFRGYIRICCLTRLRRTGHFQGEKYRLFPSITTKNDLIHSEKDFMDISTIISAADCIKLVAGSCLAVNCWLKYIPLMKWNVRAWQAQTGMMKNISIFLVTTVSLYYSALIVTFGRLAIHLKGNWTPCWQKRNNHVTPWESIDPGFPRAGTNKSSRRISMSYDLAHKMKDILVISYRERWVSDNVFDGQFVQNIPTRYGR